MMQIPTAEFKQQLVHLRSDFNMYLKEHKSKGIPLQVSTSANNASIW